MNNPSQCPVISTLHYSLSNTETAPVICLLVGTQLGPCNFLILCQGLAIHFDPVCPDVLLYGSRPETRTKATVGKNRRCAFDVGSGGSRQVPRGESTRKPSGSVLGWFHFISPFAAASKSVRLEVERRTQESFRDFSN